MRQVYEGLRLQWDQGLSERKVAQSLGISRPAVAEYVRRVQTAGLLWPLPATCDAGALERLLSYTDLAPHDGVAVIPARVGKPRDQAKVEVGVQVVERWMLARLRHHPCFALAEVHAAL